MNPRPLATFGAVAVIAALAFGSPAALSQDNRPRDSGGFKMDLSSWRSIPTHEFVLNIVDLPGAEFISAERRVRDHRVVHQRVWFDGPQGFLFVTHVPAAGGYKKSVTDRFRSARNARKTAERYWRGAGEPFDVEESAEIHTSRRRGGWVHATRGRNYGRLCFIARLGLLAKRWKVNRAAYEYYDTSIVFRDCSGKRSLADVVTWLEGAKVVGSSYNRIDRK